MIPEILSQKNIVYHYTKTHNVIEHILFQNQLRLSPRVNSIDPIENTTPSVLQCSVGYVDEPIVSNRLRDEAIEFIETRLASTKQLCFCMNNQRINFTKDSGIPKEYYGFMKPRMWDQYADNYKGVCLAFDLDKLKSESNHINKPIDYVTYDSIAFTDKDFDLNALDDEGFDYCKKYLSKMETVLYRKHSDYSGENEYRFLSQSDNDFDYINIKDSLVGIIVPEKNNTEFALKSLEKYAEDYNVKLIYINWSANGVIIKDPSR